LDPIQRKAYRVFLTNGALPSAFFWMIFTVNTLYYIQVAHLDALQLVLVGTVLEGSIFLFEVPTGLVADIYSRRLSVVIGTVLIGVGFIVEGTFPVFWTILLAQVLWGVGFTFTSGATQAWITDEIGEEQTGLAFLREAQVSQYGALAGIFAGTLLGTIGLNVPIVLGGVLFVIFSIFLRMAMPETGFHPTPREERTSWGQMWQTFRDGLRVVNASPALRSLIWIGLFYGLYSEGFDRLWQAHLLGQFVFPYFQPVVWIGLLTGVVKLLSGAANGYAARHLDTSSIPILSRSLAFISMALVLGLMAFAGFHNLFLAMAAYVAVNILRNVSSPLLDTWVNRGLDSQVRATVLSMRSQLDAFGQISGGPLVGWIARRTSIRSALLCSVLLLSPVLALFARLLNRQASNHPGHCLGFLILLNCHLRLLGRRVQVPHRSQVKRKGSMCESLLIKR
jgi:MFS transporter, DHA3 family, tetracycline resistance protein